MFTSQSYDLISEKATFATCFTALDGGGSHARCAGVIIFNIHVRHFCPYAKYFCKKIPFIIMQNTSISDSQSIAVDERVRRITSWMADGIYEKEQLASMALLCAVAGENIFLLGPPGTAKSLIARRLKGVFKDARSFDYLMSRFSTPDEIFGPISISRLKEYDRYERLTDGYLPSADVVFLDEIWKAGPSIQNTLLTAINEHIFQNGTKTVRLPMKVLIAASNELPGKDEGLEALWDRFLVRMVSNCIENDDNFERMLLSSGEREVNLDYGSGIEENEYLQWRSGSLCVGMSAELMASVKWLRWSLAQMAGKDSGEGRTLDFYVSDRRWKKVFRLMQVSAYLNGRDMIDSSDMLLLIHCLWNAPECRESVNRLVADSLWRKTTENVYAINDGLRSLVSPESDVQKASATTFVSETEFTEVYNSYYVIENFGNGTGLIAKWDYKKLSFIDATEGVEYIDNSMRLPVVQIVKRNVAFNLNLSSTMGKPKKVNLLKCSGGVVVDGTPYSLARKGVSAEKAKRTSSAPRKKELESLKAHLADCISQWNDWKQNVLKEAGRNIFVSYTDVCMIKESMNEIETRLTETEIRIKNVAKILS